MSEEECTAGVVVGGLLLVAWWLHAIGALEVLRDQVGDLFRGESPRKFK